ncbi:YhfG family protein [Pseudomonas koreensis]|uniref:YhfG family protein n=1 Tax=Pseudomonas koreensis TaxID=198620 RepID=UPI003207E07A
MSKLTFQQKQAYYDKVRRSNYLASLRLEGFDTSRSDAERPLPSRESVIEKYRQNAR